LPKPRADYVAFIASVSEIDIARLAAYIDGEGTIYINKTKKLYGRMKNPQYSLSLVISNTDPRLMSWLKKTFDGCVYGVKYERCSHLGKKPIMRWQLNERLALTVLTRCLPFMIMKREQAQIGVEFMSLKRDRKIRSRNSLSQVLHDPLSTEEISQRHAMKLEIERLNKQKHDLVIN